MSFMFKRKPTRRIIGEAEMLRRLLNEFKLFLERLLLRGAHYHLLIMASLIVLISLAAGMLAYLFTANFENLGKSTWWAFLRLSDPGYLGDDEGVLLRTVSTIVTVLGYVFFMGALIAIMTQWLRETIQKLESGLTSISQHDHVLILGWTNRTSAIVKEILVSEGRVRRFLRRIGARKLHLVILAEEVSAGLARKLRDDLGDLWSRKQITLRSGTPLRTEHLQRVAFMDASVIILPGADFITQGSELVDTRAVKTLMSISNQAIQQGISDPPLVVAEILDPRKVSVARTAYPGENEVVAGDSVISRLIAQNVRHRGLSHVYSELLTHNEGNEIYIRDFSHFEGRPFHSAAAAFAESILLGILRRKGRTLTPMLNPPHDFEIRKDDRMVVLAKSFKATEPGEDREKADVPQITIKRVENKHLQKRLLILGWNRKIPSLIQEFDSYESESFDIVILSLVPLARREEYMSRYDLTLRHVSLRHLHGDYTAPSDLSRIQPEEYDNILFLGNDRLDSNEESDARAIMGSLILREMLSQAKKKPEVIMELMDPESEKLFLMRTGEVIISPLILSHILAHVALRRELNTVFEELFTVGGAEIFFRDPSGYGLNGHEVSFRELQNTVAQYGEIALGVRVGTKEKEKNGGIVLNPSRDSLWDLKEIKSLVVLTTYA